MVRGYFDWGIMLRTENQNFRLLTAIGGVVIALLLGGCASGTAAPPVDTAPDATSNKSADEQIDAPSDSDSTANAQGAATVSIDGRTFEFDLRMCSVYEGGEALISGLGSEVGSDVPSHLDGDSVTFEDGEFRIDIGAEGPFESSDDFLAIGSSLGGAFSLAEDGDGYLVTGQAWSPSSLELGTGTLQFRCS